MEYKLLEPSIASSIGIQTPRFEGGTASLFTSTSFLYMLFFVAIIVVAAFKYTEAGVRRMEASERGIKYSNEIFKKTTLGLLGVFSLWLILSTINKDLLTGNVGLEKLRTSGISAGGGSSVRPTTGGGGDSSYDARVKSHTSVVARLASSNIHTNHNDTPCTDAQFKEKTPPCTSLAYLPEETIQKLLSLNAACRCSVVISGGTEPGHSTHREGSPQVDLQKNSSLDDFLKKNTTSPPIETTDCHTRYIWSGVSFCDEKPRDNSTWAPHYHLY